MTFFFTLSWRTPEISRKICENSFSVFFFFFLRTPEVSRIIFGFLRKDLLFSWRALARCVFGPLPRAFLSLASSGSFLEKSVLGLEFFFSPLPRTLSPRLNR